jgi:hypothetical protein
VATNPPAISADTDPASWRIQMSAIAARTPQQRLDEWAQLNVALADMEMAALRRRRPDLNDRMLLVLAARTRYGKELTDVVWPEESAALDG